MSNPTYQNLAVKIAQRFAAGWLNSVNGKYFSLYWSKAKWRLEEMPNGEPIPALRSFTDESHSDAYELPMLAHEIQGIDPSQPRWKLNPSTILQYAHLRGEPTGPEARQMLIAGYDAYFKDLLSSLAENLAESPHSSATADIEYINKNLDKWKRKLTWKKVR